MDIEREQLLVWAGSPEAGGDLPRLIRRLVLETTTTVEQVDFPGGGGVASGGFDGVVRTSSASGFVPEGLSAWEVSVQDGANAKADEDYEKRTDTPDGSPTADCTYVQVICRPWTDRRTWASQRTSEGYWREVRAYNVDSLETWLEQSPATTAWLAQRIGLPTGGITAADDWFQVWQNATQPPTTTDLVLPGRAEHADRLRKLLVAEPRVVTIGGDLRTEELRAFIAAVLTAPDSPEDTGAKAVFVDDRDSFNRLLRHPTPTVLILPDPAWLPVDPGHHHIIVPVAGSKTADVVVTPVERSQIKDALQVAGVERREAEELAELARRSLLALRRRLAKHPELHRPSWAQPGAPRIRRRLLLADRWHDVSDGDRDALTQLVGIDYATLEEELTGLAAAADDPMVGVIDGLWHVVSPKDAWLLLGGQLTRDDLEAFRSLVPTVLAERDPSLDLPPGERWLAGMRGLRRRHSETLREGLAHTLAKLGAYDDLVDTGSGMTGQRWADLIVRELLDRANDEQTLDTWVSMASVLPLLAEAAPKVLLRAVRDSLEGDEPLLGGMFRDQETDSLGLSASSPHTYLLWSLERLAWAPEHFEAAVTLLARLTVIDPGGRLINRPQNSLESIFCPWLPHTVASEEQRTAALQRLGRNFPDVAWRLLLSHLPDSHDIQVEGGGAEYRDWGRDRPTVTRPQHLRMVEKVADMLIAWLSDDPARCVELIERADNLPPTQRRALADKLMSFGVPDGPLTAPQRAQAWETLRSQIAGHREYADAHWALPEAELRPLVDAMDAFAPTEPVARHAWLFRDGLITLGDVSLRDGHDAYEAALAARRHDAVREVLNDGGLDAVLAMAEQVAAPHYVGVALGHMADDTHDQTMLTLLDGPDETVRRAAFGYVWERFRQGGWVWLDPALAVNPALPPAAAARALLASRDPTQAMSRAETLDESVASCYWQEFKYTGLGKDFDMVDEAARKLLDANRPAAAVDLLALYERRREGDPEHAMLVADALDALLTTPHDEESRLLSGHEFSVLFDVLSEHRDTVGDERVIRIEWTLAPALGYEPDLHSIYNVLVADPALFVELVKMQYPHDSDEEPTDDQRRAAQNAFRILTGWKTCPGRDGDGTIDFEQLRTWVHEARAQFAVVDLQKVGDIHIGEALAAAGGDADGTWPARPVREVLEEFANDDIEEGFEIQTCNNRGVTSRSPEAGGEAERGLSATYQAHAEQVRTLTPRIAAVLDRLADKYEAEARWHDEEAERRRRGLGW